MKNTRKRLFLIGNGTMNFCQAANGFGMGRIQQSDSRHNGNVSHKMIVLTFCSAL
jgi:hypothetical protein